MNCVPDPTLDMKTLDGCREVDKQNKGGPELDKMLTAACLEDVYKRFNGPKREYTWFSETVYKRHDIDRIYVQSYQSEMRWVSAAPDHKFFRATNARSDHLAMIATRTTSQHDSECRIDLHPPAYRAPADGEARTSGISAGLVGRSIGG
jgi:hypothetical protein